MRKFLIVLFTIILTSTITRADTATCNRFYEQTVEDFIMHLGKTAIMHNKHREAFSLIADILRYPIPAGKGTAAANHARTVSSSLAKVVRDEQAYRSSLMSTLQSCR